ncbi:MAG: methyltransferase [Shewanella sp.]|nr:methyltransferase [Shewanella sp.]MCF1432114.1 methyltransferase [Shewanella sp.]MCF1439658.1 methyltransferase [Shewanella sp.]MCF1458521.1 methyltransferase [Shewanella sp.]
MTTQFSATSVELDLHRYPQTQISNLQAWDAADEHLLKWLDEHTDTLSLTYPLCLINDSFGALTCAIRAQWPTVPLWLETDAKTSLLGCRENLLRNELTTNAIQWCNSREALPGTPLLVLMKLPKNLSYFTHQLSRLSAILPQGTQLLIGAKAKSINQSLLSLIAKHLGPATASLAWKKTRVITVIADGKSRPEPAPQRWDVPQFKLTLTNLSNVFAANKLDIGARIMLDNLPDGDFQQVIDLGCGNGILGLRAAQLYPKASIHFVDDSEMAVASARENWQTNGFEPERGHFHWDDCLTHLDAGLLADLVLCNPPFHQGEAITDHIAWQMFNDARKRLKPGGLLHIVGNRHLGYHIKLKRLFGNCKTVASNGKFVILQSAK